MNKIDTRSISFCIIQILGLAATSEIFEIAVCGNLKTPVPFVLYNLGFIVVFSHSCSFFVSFILCQVAFLLSLCFSKTQRILHSLLQGTKNLKYSIVALSVVLQKRSFLISRNKIKTVWGV